MSGTDFKGTFSRAFSETLVKDAPQSARWAATFDGDRGAVIPARARRWRRLPLASRRCSKTCRKRAATAPGGTPGASWPAGAATSAHRSGRETRLHDLMDAACDAKETHEASKGPGHVRGGDETRGPPSGAGGGHPVRVRGHAKVFGQLMFALLALTVDQIIRRASSWRRPT